MSNNVVPKYVKVTKTFFCTTYVDFYISALCCSKSAAVLGKPCFFKMVRYSSTDFGGFFNRNRVFLTAIKNEVSFRLLSCIKNRSGCCALTLYYVLEKVPPQLGKSLEMARPEGFEPPTPWFVARYSIQLSYGRVDLAEREGFEPSMRFCPILP